ncbi:MAG: hypothetical protein AABW41_04035 [Nanoarchaeota archaeon]
MENAYKSLEREGVTIYPAFDLEGARAILDLGKVQGVISDLNFAYKGVQSYKKDDEVKQALLKNPRLASVYSAFLQAFANSKQSHSSFRPPYDGMVSPIILGKITDEILREFQDTQLRESLLSGREPTRGD